jgi:signal transduction histidine kinase
LRRRELLSAVLGGLAGMLPFQSRASVAGRASARALEDQLATMAAERDYLVQRAEHLFSHLQCFASTISREDQHQMQILSLVSEMRAPLAAIDVITELLSSEKYNVNEEIRSKLAMSAKSCESLAELINKTFVLASSRQEAIAAQSW